MKTSSAKPSIFSYIDYRQFLQAWYDYNKTNIRGFSYGTWTLQCGFKSRSFIQLVMVGKRNLGIDSIPHMLKSLKLNATESEYFEHLVHYAHTTTFQNKDFHFQKILKLNKMQTGTQVRDVYKYLSNPITPRVQVLLNMKSLTCTTKYIAHTFSISEAEAQDILNNIQSCGLAAYQEKDQCWRSTEDTLRIPDELGNIAIQTFHNRSLVKAQEAIALPPQSRKFESFFTTLREEEYLDFQQDVDQFINFLSSKYTSKDITGAKVYQVNLSAIPASRTLTDIQSRVE
ncbi:TIGR02147 family protein [Bdellovibrio sp. HCB290]|uniref:TIGR02147 family protein n=1 Tax=Bdellovibrio sp. HCB290 TaxID=3394356 RepID=UPI0039B61436